MQTEDLTCGFNKDERAERGEKRGKESVRKRVKQTERKRRWGLFKLLLVLTYSLSCDSAGFPSRAPRS